MNSLRNIFGGGGFLGGPLANISNFFQKLQQFATNPIGALLGLNVNIPQNVRNDPQATVNYLRSSGQMSEDQFNQFSQLANQIQQFFPRKFQ